MAGSRRQLTSLTPRSGFVVGVASCILQVLKPFLDSGQLDMAIFDAVNDTTIKLSRSGVLLGPGTCVNPICIVANYLFDTLCHDIFQVSGVYACLPFHRAFSPRESAEIFLGDVP